MNGGEAILRSVISTCLTLHCRYRLSLVLPFLICTFFTLTPWIYNAGNDTFLSEGAWWLLHPKHLFWGAMLWAGRKDQCVDWIICFLWLSGCAQLLKTWVCFPQLTLKGEPFFPVWKLSLLLEWDIFSWEVYLESWFDQALCKFTFDNLFIKCTKYLGRWVKRKKANSAFESLEKESSFSSWHSNGCCRQAKRQKEKASRKWLYNTILHTLSKKISLSITSDALKHDFLFHSPWSTPFPMQESTHHKLLLYAVMQVPVISALT